MEAIIKVMESTIGARDPYTVGHQQRVTQVACAIAAEMGLSEDKIRELRVAGSLHDLGKIAVPVEILSKPGKLSDIEFSMIKSHPQVAYDILKPLEFPGQINQIILQHHERWDASGYPRGLKGRDILLEARILAVADVVEAMCSHRPYRPALGLEKALEEVSQHGGVLYDKAVVKACLKVFEQDESLRDLITSGTPQPQSVRNLTAAKTLPPSLKDPKKPGNLSNLKGYLEKVRFLAHASATSVAAGMIMIAVRGA